MIRRLRAGAAFATLAVVGLGIVLAAVHEIATGRWRIG